MTANFELEKLEEMKKIKVDVETQIAARRYQNIHSNVQEDFWGILAEKLKQANTRRK
jgi:hypothetical protein